MQSVMPAIHHFVVAHKHVSRSFEKLRILFQGFEKTMLELSSGCQGSWITW